MDADDICTPQRFALQFEYLRDHPRVAVVGGAVDIFKDGDGDGEKWEGGEDNGASRVVRHPASPALAHFGMYLYCSLAHPAVMARASVLRAVGPVVSLVLSCLVLSCVRVRFRTWVFIFSDATGVCGAWERWVRCDGVGCSGVRCSGIKWVRWE